MVDLVFLFCVFDFASSSELAREGILIREHMSDDKQISYSLPFAIVCDVLL